MRPMMAPLRDLTLCGIVGTFESTAGRAKFAKIRVEKGTLILI